VKPGYFLIRPIVVIRVLVVVHDPGGDPVVGDDEALRDSSRGVQVDPVGVL